MPVRPSSKSRRAKNRDKYASPTSTATGQGRLYLVPVPIGNVKDITYRAIETLSSVDLIAAEDTRTLSLLQREYKIRTRSVSYHNFNERTRSQRLINRLLAGQDVALVSDAGTPLISDPGFQIVRTSIQAGISVVSLPGACAAVTALVASGLPVNRFLFVGFPPRVSGRRRALFTDLRHESATLVFYEAPHRLIATLQDLKTVLGDRQISLARNLTKQDESTIRGSIAGVLEQLALEEKVRGESTLVIAGVTNHEPSPESDAIVREEILGLLRQGLDTRKILRQISATHKELRRREIYDMLLSMRVEKEDTE